MNKIEEESELNNFQKRIPLKRKCQNENMPTKKQCPFNFSDDNDDENVENDFFFIHNINQGLNNVKNKYQFVFDSNLEMLFYTWCKKTFYKICLPLEFIKILRNNISKHSLNKLKTLIENKEFFQIIKHLNISKVKIDKPFILPINKQVIFDLKETFLNNKIPKLITMKKSSVTFSLNTAFTQNTPNKNLVYQTFSKSSIKKIVNDIYHEKGTKLLLYYLSKDKETNSAFICEIMEKLFELWEKKGFYSI